MLIFANFFHFIKNSKIFIVSTFQGIAGYDPTAGRPNIEEWLKLVRELTNPVYDEAHAIAYKVRERQQQ